MATPGTQTGSDLEALNTMLRGELSAVETYDQSLSKFDQGHEEARTELTRIRGEHQSNVTALQAKVREHGGEPSTGSGPWGSFTQVVTAGAKLLGPQTTLAALKTGEEHGINDYQSVLDNPRVAEAVKATIRDSYLPAAREHVRALDALSAKLESK